MVQEILGIPWQHPAQDFFHRHTKNCRPKKQKLGTYLCNPAIHTQNDVKSNKIKCIDYVYHEESFAVNLKNFDLVLAEL